MVRRAGKPRIPERDEYDAEPGTAPVAEVAWDDVERRLADEQNYWLVTTRADGPAAIAIWAVCVERALWFTSNPDTASAKHLASEPRALAHLESGSEPVVLEGRVDRPAPEAVPERVVEAYRVKVRLAFGSEGQRHAVPRSPARGRQSLASGGRSRIRRPLAVRPIATATAALLSAQEPPPPRRSPAHTRPPKMAECARPSGCLVIPVLLARGIAIPPITARDRSQEKSG